MARFLQSLRSVLGLRLPPPASSSPPRPSFTRSGDCDYSIFREGDRAIIHAKVPYLTKPLKHGERTEVSRGVIHHDDIIGSRVWDPIKAHKGSLFRLSLPTLEEYVVYTPRLVTPIYGADANLIVSLLDIHVLPPPSLPPASDGATPLEILEAGTGHGSLTLHLARAIHAANTQPPPIPKNSQVRILANRPVRPYADAAETTSATAAARQEEQAENTEQKQWDEWRAQRSAVIHTVDVSSKFSTHAEKTVRGFRRGLYAGNVDFHVGPVEEWIADQTRQRSSNNNKKAFLSYAILDMPSAHQRIPHVAPVLKRDGVLVVFMPSITQIGECVQLIAREKLPFVMDKVVELGTGLSSGRMWDVRVAVKKSRADPSSWVESSRSEAADSSVSEEDGSSGSSTSSTSSEGPPEGPSEPAAEDNNVLVCRPKVGLKIVGGGFIGIWRRIEDRPQLV
ncbi:uncharacterized protein TRUGW13939_02694 [Talaromyces rugulosus]|uniref:tRNA (adenine(58)-N(1))-methyltransferase catalytic subunit TRM61 n=1 Tax=Talaromyces rugulosus TaxID=121627 RepID=A0A7H8QNZ3_TALRU|nr:uncharacterized protein TRUGW13939_02694 [Talaromyces rugulosus]QKX55598.1 hypothetical protein TRUGW13939_02694 [Talaromyces rugulosus]